MKLEGRHMCWEEEKLTLIPTSSRPTETLGLLGHPFNIDLIPVELGSFDVIIGMDWLANHHAVIVYDEKTVRIPYGDEVLIVQVTKKETKDKSEENGLEDVPIVRDFSEVFPKNLLGLPPTRQVEFQIDLVPSVAPVARALYRLATSELQELSTQLYHQLRVREEYIPKTTFRTRYAHYEFQVMPILGFYTNELGGHSWDDDELNKKEHEEHLWLILRLLKKEELYAKFLKCLAGYYRRFIKSFSKITKPMTKLTQKSVKFDWSEKAEAAFQLLKQKLCSAPILSIYRRILNAQDEARKEENYGIEDLCGMIKKLEPRADEMLCLMNRSWIPYYCNTLKMGRRELRDTGRVTSRQTGHRD
ncbi:putative reverse transcriptase domain-containing protein [Tanacetum coccineum]